MTAPAATRVAKGARPGFSSSTEIDHLLAIVLALTSEVSVLRERLDAVERIAAERGLFTTNDIDAFKPDASVLEERDQMRAEYLDRVLAIIGYELAGLQDGS